MELVNVSEKPVAGLIPVPLPVLGVILVTAALVQSIETLPPVVVIAPVEKVTPLQTGWVVGAVTVGEASLVTFTVSEHLAMFEVSVKMKK